MVKNFLVARRLIEAGARVVSLNYSRWDWHGGDGLNFPRSREEMPLLDQGLSALITDALKEDDPANTESKLCPSSKSHSRILGLRHFISER